LKIHFSYEDPIDFIYYSLLYLFEFKIELGGYGWKRHAC